MTFSAIGTLEDKCPYCGEALQKRPARKSKCTFCGKPIFVRKRPLDERSVLLREDQLPELERQWAADYEIKSKMRAITGKHDRGDATSVADADRLLFEHARAYMEKTARDHLKSHYVHSLQVRLSSLHLDVDCCDLYADADMWGLGRGVYPKAEAPVPPFHSGCRCALAPIITRPKQSPRRRQTEAEALKAGFTPAVAAQIQAQIHSGKVIIKKAKDC